MATLTDAQRGIFGAYLHGKLENKDLSVQGLVIQIRKLEELKGRGDLAAQLQLGKVHPYTNTIHQWLRGRNVPAAEQPLLPHIAEILRIPIDELERKRLEARQASYRPRVRRIDAAKEITGALAGVRGRVDNKELFDQLEDCRNLSGGATSRGISGVKSLMETAISILYKLGEGEPPKKGSTILMTFQGKVSGFRNLPHLQPFWIHAIKTALEKGWNIVHLFRIDENFVQTINIVSDVLYFIGYEGKYEPRAFPKGYTLPVAQSFLLIPDRDEGLISYGKDQADHIDAGIYIKDSAQLRILADYFKQLQRHTKPFFKSYDSYLDNEFLEIVSQADKEPGPRIAILKRLSEITRPLSWYEPSSRWAIALGKSFNLSPEDPQYEKLIAYRRSRLENLQQHLEKYSARYMYTGKCVEQFAKDGTANSSHNYFTAERCERYEQLMNMVGWLEKKKYKNNYQIALFEEEIVPSNRGVEPIKTDEINPFFCEVLHDNLVIMEVPNKGRKTSSTKWLLIKEPVLVHAFHQYLMKLWNTIPDERKDTAYVSRWLRNRAEKVKD